MNKDIISCLCIALFLLMLGAPTGISADEGTGNIEEATYLIDEIFRNGYITGDQENFRAPGWDLDFRGGYTELNGAPLKIHDTSNTEAVAMKKKFDRIQGGTAVLEISLVPTDVVSGFEFSLSDGKGKAIHIETVNDSFCFLNSTGQLEKLCTYEYGMTYGFKIVFDFEKGTAQIAVNGKLLRKIPILNSCGGLDNILIKTSDKEIMNINIYYVKLYVNYLVNEFFSTTAIGAQPYDWEIECPDENAVSVRELICTTRSEPRSLKIDDTSVIDRCVIKKEFEPIDGKICFEMKFMLPQKSDNVKFELRSDEATVACVYTKGDGLYFGNSKLWDYSANVWYTLRIEADKASRKADIRINGKLILAAVAFESDKTKINNIRIATSYNQKTLMWVDDIKVFEILPEPADYVSEPIIPEKKGNFVPGTMMCSLWREGSGFSGWDVLNPYADRRPYLGYYDEGNPEVADWEIKWMAENGLDYQIYCWYYQGNNVPIKDSAYNNALHDGFFNAKYSDKMKYCIMWETSGSGYTSEVFRNYIVPYWTEYYLKDSRYLTINNRPVIAFYRIDKVLEHFGGVQGAKAEMEYLREVCKGLGYDDPILLIDFAGTSNQTWEEIKEVGFDATFVYGWTDDSGKDPNIQITSIQKQQETASIDIVPTASLGRQKDPWYGYRDEMNRYLSPSDLEEVLSFYTGDFQTNRTADSDVSKLVMINCWNEYGEGHYIAPSGAYGFGYMDSIRNVFTKKQTFENAMPDDAALRRMSRLYPENRRTFKRTPGRKNDVSDMQVVKGWYFSDGVSGDDWKIEKQVGDFGVKNGALSGITTDVDPGFATKNKLNIDLNGIKHVKVRMKTDAVFSRLEMFFVTEASPQYIAIQNQRCTLSGSADEFVDYYFDFTGVTGWEGVLTGLRIDPGLDAGKSFEVESIEILRSVSGSVDVEMNGEKFEPKRELKLLDSTLYFPLEELLERAKAYTEFDYASKKVKIEYENTVIELVQDDNTAKINGESVTLSTPMFFDEESELYYVPLRFVFEKLGYNVAWEATQFNKCVILTDKNKRTQVVSNTPTADVEKVPYQWEFNSDGDNEKFTTGNVSNINVKNGLFKATASTDDPQVRTPVFSINSKDYSKLVIGMQNSTPGTRMQVFFITDKDKTWNTVKCITVPISAETKSVNEYTVDMTNCAAWKGNITQIRIDPVDTTGNFSIDYIRLIMD